MRPNLHLLKPSRLCIFILPLLLSACALSPQQKSDYAKVEHSGVSPKLYQKMVHRDPLTIRDIESLSAANVSTCVILRYLRDRESTYYLSGHDVRQLDKAGVDPKIVDYLLLNSEGTWWSPGPYPFFGAGSPAGGPGFYSGYASGFYHGSYGFGHHP